MNKIMTNTGAAFAIVLAGAYTLGFAGDADARTMKHAPAATMSTTASTPLEQAIRASNGSDFNIVSEMQLPKQDAAFIQETTSDSQLNGIHEAIAANRSLASKLAAQNIEVKEITGADRAADGSLILYTM